MSMKRKHDENGNLRSKKEAKTDDDKWMEYVGYSLQQMDAYERKIAVEDGTIGARDFFAKYVAARRPCVMNVLPKLASGKSPCISLKELQQVAADKQVQVERRYATSEAFGQNRTASRQLLMTVSNFLKNLEGKDGSLYYLSTQESEKDDPFQVPCRQLLDNGCIAANVPWAGNLVLDSCNLVCLLVY